MNFYWTPGIKVLTSSSPDSYNLPKAKLSALQCIKNVVALERRSWTFLRRCQCIPLDIRRKLSVQKMFSRHPVRHLNISYTFNLRPVCSGYSQKWGYWCSFYQKGHKLSTDKKKKLKYFVSEKSKRLWVTIAGIVELYNKPWLQYYMRKF